MKRIILVALVGLTSSLRLCQPLVLAQTSSAGETSDPVAQCKLADRCYADDDLYRAELWYCKAAVQGLADGQFGLGRLLMVQVYHMENGKVIARKPNLPGAAEWFLRAANQGHVVAQVYLGNFYRDGKGVKQDYVEAYKWYEVAIRSNNNDVKADRDALMLKMSADQVAEGQRRADAFLKKE